MLKVDVVMTGAEQAAMRASATPQALKNLFFNQIVHETELIKKTAQRNALQFPEHPTGKLASSIRSEYKESGDRKQGWVIADMRVAPYAEFVEFGHYAGSRSATHRPWVPGLFYMEKAFLEVRRGSERRVKAAMNQGLKWYDSPGAVHKDTGEQLSIL